MATTYQPTYGTDRAVLNRDMAVRGYQVSQFTVALGRVLFSGIFVMQGLAHFSPELVNYAAAQGVPLAGLLVPLSGLMIIIGGLSVAFGYLARWGALLIALFLIPVTLMMHNFWSYSDPMMWQMQFINFMKNLSMLGAALFIMHFGSGPVSIDSYLMRHPSPRS